MAGTRRERAGELRLQVIGSNLIEVSAIGAFGSADVDAISVRLARLASGGPARVRIDCSRVIAIDPEIIELLSTAAAEFARVGGVLQLVDVPEHLGVTDGIVTAGADR